MVASVCFFCSFVLKTVPIFYDDNTFTWIYIVVSILDRNYSPLEPTGQGSAAQTFDGKLTSASLWIFITCSYGDLRAHLLKGTCISVHREPIRDTV